MSVASDFRAVLIGNAPLVALVPAARIAQNAVDGSGAYPAIVFLLTQEKVRSVDNTLLAEQCQIEVQCWAETAAAADAVAAAVETALASTLTASVLGQASAFDPDTGYDGTILTVSWWDV